MNLIGTFDPWGNICCSCPAKLSLSPYTGCSHGCLYCYASSYIPNFFVPRPKKNFLNRLQKEIGKIPAGATITLANSSDPYLHLEKKLKLTRAALELFCSYSFKILIVTKSTLIQRDIDILKKLNVVVAMTITSLNSRLTKKLEPFTESGTKRLSVVKKLSAHVPVIVRADPLIPYLNVEEMPTLLAAAKKTGARQVVTSVYKARPDNFKRMTTAFARYKQQWDKLYKQTRIKKSGYWHVPSSVSQPLLQTIRTQAINVGLEFSSCREGIPQYNTKPCDGSCWLAR